MNCQQRMLLLLAIVAVALLWINSSPTNSEGFYADTGTFCTTCQGKNRNQCNKCFNCGVLQDQIGNQGCVAGDVHGPYNYEMTPGSVWYHTDPFSEALKKNRGCKRCSDGPSNASRALGEYYLRPCV